MCMLYRMALLYRTNLNVPFFINNVCYKFSTGVTKLQGSKQRIQAQLKDENKLLEKNSFSKTRQKLTFKELLRQRKKDAYSSILVQVQSDNSFGDLHAYCSLYGTIVSVDYYRLYRESADRGQHFFLVQYKSPLEVQNILSSASYPSDDIIPVRTSMLWFRKVREEPKLHNSLQNQLSLTRTNLSIPSVGEIAHGLANAPDVSSQIAYLYKKLKLGDLEVKLRFQIIIQFEQCLRSLFPHINVEPFGSSISGFGIKMCDLDLKLIINDINNEVKFSKLMFQSKHFRNNEKLQIQQFMGTLADMMQHFMPGIQHVQRILKARVPIIKFHHAFTGVDCDLSMKHDVICVAELLCLLGQIDFRVRPLVITVKKWAQFYNLTSLKPGRTITNFPITLLVIFYLQQKKILPPINYMQLFARLEDVNGSKQYTFTPLHDVTKLPKKFFNNVPNDDLGELLCGFFEYYLQFDFGTKAVCLSEGETKQKPKESDAVYIYNPVDKMHNVGQNITQYDLNCILIAMRTGLLQLESTTKSSAKNWGILSWFEPVNSKVSSSIFNALELLSNKEDNIVKVAKVNEKNVNDLSEVSPQEVEKDVEKNNTVKMIEKIDKSNIDNTFEVSSHEEKKDVMENKGK